MNSRTKRMGILIPMVMGLLVSACGQGKLGSTGANPSGSNKAAAVRVAYIDAPDHNLMGPLGKMLDGIFSSKLIASDDGSRILIKGTTKTVKFGLAVVQPDGKGYLDLSSDLAGSAQWIPGTHEAVWSNLKNEVYRYREGKGVEKVTDLPDEIQTMKVSPDGRWVLIGTHLAPEKSRNLKSSKVNYLLDLQSGNRQLLKDLTDDFFHMNWLDSKTLVFQSRDEKTRQTILKTFSVSEGKSTPYLTLPDDLGVWSETWSRDGKAYIHGWWTNGNGKERRADFVIDKGQIIATCPDTAQISPLAWSADGKYLAVSVNKAIRVATVDELRECKTRTLSEWAETDASGWVQWHPKESILVVPNRKQEKLVAFYIDESIQSVPLDGIRIRDGESYIVLP